MFSRSRLCLHIISMNRDKDLNRILSQCKGYFDIIRVCDGADSIDTKNIVYSNGAEYYNRMWDDKYQEQDNVLLSKARAKDWILIMDDDELPSTLLLENIKSIIQRARNTNCNMVSLPCLLSLDNETLCSEKEFIGKVKEGSIIPFRKYWLFEYDKTVKSYGTPHRSVETHKGWKVYDQPYPYYHYKTRNSFIVNECLHTFINPMDQGLNRSEIKDFQDSIKKCSWVMSQDVLRSLISGKVPEEFISFIWRYKDKINKPTSKWFWSYYFIYNKDKIPNSFDKESDLSYKGYTEYMRDKR